MTAPSETGTVYLIGAGPGDPDLITIRGKQLFQKCQAVLYDNLVPEELIVTLPDDVQKYYVGKKAGKTCYSQDEINRLMVKLAREGKDVARLKGSDPLIFGRGSEEARYLKENGIRFEIVPGITSGIAALTYAGIPCTDREASSFVLLVTGHKAKGKEADSVSWDWVARARHGTVVIYMGVSEIEHIVTKLIDSGMSGEMPAAVIERGSYPTQRVLTSKLQQLPDIVRAHNVCAPAIFVLGEVVNLQKWLHWFDGKPLFGVRVMVTRPADQAQEMYSALRGFGAEVLAYPTIATSKHVDAPAWLAYEKITTAKRWLVFTSENGVRYFMKQFLSKRRDIRTLHTFKIAAVGDGTSRALAKYHLTADFVPSEATTGALAEQLAESDSWKAATVVRVRGNLSYDNIEKRLAEAGAEVIPMTVYETLFPKWPEGFKEKLFEYPPDVVTFTSGSSVEGLFANLSKNEVEQIVEGATLLSIGPSTSKVASAHGLSVAIEVKQHSIASMADELVWYAKLYPLRRST